MEFKNLLIKIEAGLATVTINRPDVLNALDRTTLQELELIFSNFLLQHPIKAVIITGAGKAFVAGADIKAMVQMSAEEARQFSLLGQWVFSLIEQFPAPVIAAINGYALGGGCELALACDLRIAAENAKLGQPEVNLGILPGFGGTQRLTRLLGSSKAKELLFTGDMISATTALQMGLVNSVCSADVLMDRVNELAQKMIAKSSLGMVYCKRAILMGNDLPIQEALEMEANLFALAFATEDQKEGMRAFLEKRPPVFRGR